MAVWGNLCKRLTWWVPEVMCSTNVLPKCIFTKIHPCMSNNILHTWMLLISFILLIRLYLQKVFFSNSVVLQYFAYLMACMVYVMIKFSELMENFTNHWIFLNFSLEQVNNLREIQAMRRLSPHANILELQEVIL